MALLSDAQFGIHIPNSLLKLTKPVTIGAAVLFFLVECF